MSNKLFTITLIGISLGGYACTEPSRSVETLSNQPEAVSSQAMVDTTLGQSYTIEVWYTDPAEIDTVLAGLRPLANRDLESQLVLRARGDEQVVQITDWASESAARTYTADKATNEQYKILRSELMSHAARDFEQLAIDTGSSVQYSEFLMKRASALDTLSNIARAMTTGMARSEPTLDFIMTLNSTDSSTISLFGLWNTEAGFEIFSENNTFGDQPYWGPYAENDHHMFDVVRAEFNGQ
ncbi:hypothetical protein [Tunicatimonas pelagia]|uniref:hypothetical protein n=1 Tax=Tunicatimonas pelagia TaxID=931531 RepID=UPI0026654362|nr:hypothetical protein [Tunicatimonas pelagia]WKN44824.1 hypothetical protein P0M28_07585 [Tunicatimonas pelagia]